MTKMKTEIRQYYKGVVWPRGQIKEQNKTNYRYLVIGILITDKPIPELEGINEIVCEGETQDFVKLLQELPKRGPNVVLGDATDVLLSMEAL